MDYYVNIIKNDENNKNIKINGYYLIERAIEYNDIKSIKYLLNINCNIYIPKLLYNPIKFNKTKIIDLLYNHSTLIFEQLDNKKHNALHYAIRFNNKKIIDKLINKINLFDLDIYNNTYLHYAIKYNNENVIIYIINLILKDNTNNYIKLLEIKNNNSLTPIMYMIKNNIKIEIIGNLFFKLINNIYINYNICDDNNYNILNYIIMYFNNEQIKNLFKILYKSLSYINWNNQDNNGNTILHHLIYNNINLYNTDINNDFDYYIFDMNKYNINFEIPLINYLKINKNNKKLISLNNIFFMLLLTNSNLLFSDIKGNSSLYYLLKYNIDDNILKYINDNNFKNKQIENIINNKNISLKDLDKKHIFKFYNNITKKINTNIQYTTLPFDIICSFIKLSILNYNLTINFNNFNNIDYEKSLFFTSLKYILIWENKKLINQHLLNNLTYFNGFVLFFIIIKYDNFNHMNILICDNNKKFCYRFDPFGYYYNKMYDLNLLDNLLNKFCNNIKYNYLFYNEIIGIQQYERKNKLYINDLNGYCLVWCLLFAEDFIKNNKFSLDYFINNFNLLYNNENFYNFKLKEKQNELTKIRDIILNSLHIDINNYCNDISDLNVVKKIFSELFNIYNKFLKY